MPVTKPEKIAAIVRDAGGEIIGRTRLQKIAYLLDVAGYEDDFRFTYKHYGPFSEDVADAARIGALFGILKEEERVAAWGGTYSVYSADKAPDKDVPDGRSGLVKLAAKADAVELELAATAVFLAREGLPDPWGETARRKPEKAEGERLDKAKALLAKLKQINVLKPLPDIG